jgi:hypothetical protein
MNRRSVLQWNLNLEKVYWTVTAREEPLLSSDEVSVWSVCTQTLMKNDSFRQDLDQKLSWQILRRWDQWRPSRWHCFSENSLAVGNRLSLVVQSPINAQRSLQLCIFLVWCLARPSLSGMNTSSVHIAAAPERPSSRFILWTLSKADPSLCVLMPLTSWWPHTCFIQGISPSISALVNLHHLPSRCPEGS